MVCKVISKCFDPINYQKYSTCIYVPNLVNLLFSVVVELCDDGDIAVRYVDGSEEEVPPGDLQLRERGPEGKAAEDAEWNRRHSLDGDGPDEITIVLRPNEGRLGCHMKAADKTTQEGAMLVGWSAHEGQIKPESGVLVGMVIVMIDEEDARNYPLAEISALLSQALQSNGAATRVTFSRSEGKKHIEKHWKAAVSHKKIDVYVRKYLPLFPFSFRFNVFILRSHTTTLSTTTTQ